MPKKGYHAWEPEPEGLGFPAEKVHHFYVAASRATGVTKPGHAGNIQRRLTQIRRDNEDLSDATMGVVFECRCPLERGPGGREHCDWERSWERLHSNEAERSTASEKYLPTRSVLGTLEMWSRYPINKVSRELALNWVRSIRSAAMRRSA